MPEFTENDEALDQITKDASIAFVTAVAMSETIFHRFEKAGKPVDEALAEVQNMLGTLVQCSSPLAMKVILFNAMLNLLNFNEDVARYLSSEDSSICTMEDDDSDIPDKMDVEDFLSMIRGKMDAVIDRERAKEAIKNATPNMNHGPYL